MKISLLFLSLVFFASCSKNKDDVASRGGNGQPSASSITFDRAYAGSNLSIRFTVRLNIPNTSAVTKVNLLRLPSRLAWEVSKPESKEYIMYDHAIDTWPTAQQQAFYQLEFKMADGTSVLGEKFQVY